MSGFENLIFDGLFHSLRCPQTPPGVSAGGGRGRDGEEADEEGRSHG